MTWWLNVFLADEFLVTTTYQANCSCTLKSLLNLARVWWCSQLATPSSSNLLAVLSSVCSCFLCWFCCWSFCWSSCLCCCCLCHCDCQTPTTDGLLNNIFLQWQIALQHTSSYLKRLPPASFLPRQLILVLQLAVIPTDIINGENLLLFSISRKQHGIRP